MSREALAFVLGRAALDEQFLERLKRDPDAAAQEMKMLLSPDEVAKLRGMDFNALAQFNKVTGGLKMAPPFVPPKGV